MDQGMENARAAGHSICLVIHTWDLVREDNLCSNPFPLGEVLVGRVRSPDTYPRGICPHDNDLHGVGHNSDLPLYDPCSSDHDSIPYHIAREDSSLEAAGAEFVHGKSLGGVEGNALKSL